MSLAAVSSARLSSHRDLCCYWSKSLTVIVRTPWSSEVSFPVLVWLVAGGCWRHDPASWSEWEAGLKNGVGPERETGEEPRGAARSMGWDRTTGYTDWIVFLVFYFFVTGLNVNTGVQKSDRFIRLKLRAFASRRNLWKCHKIDWELRCGWWFL